MLNFSVTSDALGTIALEFATIGGIAPENSTFNALSITEIPEPSRIIMLLGAFGGLLVRRRR